MSKRSLWLFLGGLLITAASGAVAQTTTSFPGGWIEKDGSGTRTRYSTAQLQSFVPTSRGTFTFPAPYNTKAVRITDASDCAGGQDCVWYVGYSYWRNSNAHQNSNDMWIFLSLANGRGGSGPTLFKLNKSTDTITKVGPMFPPGSKYVNSTAEGWYFSANTSRPNTLYMYDGPKMLRYDVVNQTFETVFDVSTQFGSDRNVWQMHSSNDDLVHSATLQVASTGEYLGCLVYMETTKTFRWYPKVGVFDECNLDKSGRWTISLEDLGVPNDEGMRIFDNQTGNETRISGPNGTLGHLDTGYGYAVGADNFNPLPNASVLWSFNPSIVEGPVVQYNVNWNVSAVQHISHENAKPNVPSSQQYACGSDASTNYAVQNEITCFRIDGSADQLIVAPVMTDPNASGGGDFYAKQPKGNLDVTGRYFIWTTNLGGNRMDAFLVKVPSQLLVNGGDTTPPAAPVNLRFQ
ncbi:MAG TPA: hypothetical protein VL261_08925 [Nitrospira sp.]|nr:hypothetical protein [Nitrospira sp.]